MRKNAWDNIEVESSSSENDDSIMVTGMLKNTQFELAAYCSNFFKYK